ncbi:MAG TPA: DNA methyltransferase, partial [Acidimicrobiia bacterium]|nr:DNA methyltransferase [Acidimicrobiia bacterium]
GVRVWEVPALPGSAAEAKLDQAIAKNSTNRLVIFHDGDQQVWRWPSRTAKGAGVISRPARHVHRVGSPDPQFVAKLDAIRLPSDVVLDVNDLLSRVRGAFDVETKNETKRASKLMAQMYAAVEKGYLCGSDPKKRDHEISVSLARVLFLLFGDDTEMWKNATGEPLPDLFQDFVKDHTERDGSDIADRFNALFEVLDTAPMDRSGPAAELAAFPYVNGGIFDEHITLPKLDKDFRDAILAASAVDWSTISPAIFGSMFQSVRDAQTRRELGEHYTSEENILKTLNPLFLDELRDEFDKILASAEAPGTKRNKLNALWGKLGAIRYMDPACGCGNFIIVAYRELRALELQIMDALANISAGEGSQTFEYDWTPMLRVTLDHFYGIEIDEWPARIAETAMFLMDRQCDLRMKERFGAAPERLPIQRAARIEVGSALTIDWADILEPSESVVIAGNPPFLGDHTRTAKQLAELQGAWGQQKTLSRLDFVTGWHAKALRYFKGHDGLWAFVTTNSIAQGDQAPRLFSEVFARGWKVKFAHRTFPWTSEAAGQAAVHCIIVGFTRAPLRSARLFEYPTLTSAPREHQATSINAYLVDGPNVMAEKRSEPLSPELSEVAKGSMATDGGNFIVTAEDLPAVLADPIARKFVRKYVGSKELLNGLERWCLWLEDASATELKRSAILSERVELVREMRLASTAATTRDYPHHHLFRQRGITPAEVFVAMPEVSSENRPYFPVARLDPGVIVSNKVYGGADPDGVLFAIASSSMLLTWLRTIGGRMKSDLSFSSTIVWNSFPLPELNSDLRAAIARAGAHVLAARAEDPERSLAQHYSAGSMSNILIGAHAALDELVDGAFGLSNVGASEEPRQEVLFASYLDLTSGLLAGVDKGRGRRRARGSRA